MLKTTIKAGSISNLTDARYFAAWGVEYMGFCLKVGEEAYIEPRSVKAIKEWVVGPKIVGEFSFAQAAEEVLQAIDILGLDAVQVDNFTSLESLKTLGEATLIQEVVVPAVADWSSLEERLEAADQWVNIFVLNFASQQLTAADVLANETVLKSLQRLCKAYKVVLDIHCASEELDAFLDTVKPYGLELKGGEEERVGVKSFDDLDDIFEALETFE